VAPPVIAAPTPAKKVEPPKEKKRKAKPSVAVPAVSGEGIVRIASDPSGRIILDGKDRGSTPREFTMPVGRHRVRVERDGFAPAEKSFTLELDQEFYWKAELAPLGQ
jgi:hypothetical protein